MAAAIGHALHRRRFQIGPEGGLGLRRRRQEEVFVLEELAHLGLPRERGVPLRSGIALESAEQAPVREPRPAKELALGDDAGAEADDRDQGDDREDKEPRPEMPGSAAPLLRFRID